ncbi:MAG: tetratricopeptide repeat protein [Chloroflexota bacterium]
MLSHTKKISQILIVVLLTLLASACTVKDSSVPDVENGSAGVPDSTGGPTAEPDWEATLSADLSDAGANYQLGLLYSISEPEKAEQYFTAALAGDPNLSPRIARIRDASRVGELSENPAYRLTLLGQALGALGEWDLAHRALELAVETDPAYAEAWAYLGEAQQHLGEDAVKALTTALELDPQSYSANLLMALYWRRNDQPGEALPLLLTAAEQDPNNLTLKEDIAHTYAEAGELETSLTLLQEIIDKNPELSASWQMLARLCLTYDLKIDEVGLPAARQAVLLAEDDPGALLLLGRAYFQTGNLSLAIRFFNQASTLDPASPDPHYYLGLLYLNQGSSESAQAELSLAYQLAPTEVIGQQALDTLNQYFDNGD